MEKTFSEVWVCGRKECSQFVYTSPLPLQICYCSKGHKMKKEKR
jgi:hypothetical protein